MAGRAAQDYAQEHLKKLSVNEKWQVLYECPETGIHWLEDYPHGELHGGGPPRLRRLPIKD